MRIQSKNSAPSCQRCQQPTELLTVLPRCDPHPTYNIFKCVGCGNVEWIVPSFEHSTDKK